VRIPSQNVRAEKATAWAISAAESPHADQKR
jgi:hypothetical protein